MGTSFVLFLLAGGVDPQMIQFCQIMKAFHIGVAQDRDRNVPIFEEFKEGKKILIMMGADKKLYEQELNGEIKAIYEHPEANPRDIGIMSYQYCINTFMK